MVLRKILQGTALVFVIGSLATATASSIRDWEGDIDEGGPEGGMPRALLDERSQLLEENDSTEAIEVTEVVVPPKRQNFAVRPRKNLPQVPLRSNRVGDIADETATTGDNAKKRLPSYVTQEQSAEPSFLHDINQVTTSLMPIDSLGKTAD